MDLPFVDPVLPQRRFRRMRAVNPLVPDVALALLFLAICLATVALSESTDPRVRSTEVLTYVLVIAGTAPLALRRRFPAITFCIIVVSIITYELQGYTDNGLAFPALISLYTVASIRPRRDGVIALVAAIVTIFVMWQFAPRSLALSDLISTTAIFLVAATVGDGVRIRRLYLQQLELRAADLARSRQEDRARAVADERLRIARELHDVVAHAMSVVAVQSGVGAHVIDQRPDEAKRVLEHINATSRDALQEMRRMLGVLRSEESADGAALAPAPTLGGVDDLAETIRAAGVPVAISIDGERNGIPAGVDLSAYRIVQEALTNVLKHAGPASAAVAVHYEPGKVVVEVRDDGRGSAADRGTDDEGLPGGHGLPGMRERVGLYGGTLDAGPCPGGGFRVTAVLPFDEHAVAP